MRRVPATRHPAPLGFRQSLTQNMFKVCRNCDGWIHLAAVGHTFLSVIPSVRFKHGNYFLFGAEGEAGGGAGGPRGILSSIPVCPWSWSSFPLCTGLGSTPFMVTKEPVSEDFSNSSPLLQPCDAHLSKHSHLQGVFPFGDAKCHIWPECIPHP